MRLISYLSPGFPPALFETIGRAIGADVDFETATSGPQPGVDPFLEGTHDLGWLCSTSYAELLTRSDPPSVQLVGVGWVPDDPAAAGRPVYFGDVVVPDGSSARTLSDLRDRRIGCNDEISLSGHLSLRFALDAMGEEPDEFAELDLTGSHHTSLDRVLAGELDACVVDSVVRLGRARHDPDMAGLRVIARLGPWPVQPLVARADLAPERVAMIRGSVLALTDDPAVRTQLAASSLAGFAETGDEEYRPVQDAFARHARR